MKWAARAILSSRSTTFTSPVLGGVMPSGTEFSLGDGEMP